MVYSSSITVPLGSIMVYFVFITGLIRFHNCLLGIDHGLIRFYTGLLGFYNGPIWFFCGLIRFP